MNSLTRYISVIFLVLTRTASFSQEAEAEQIDASKPTNFYSTLDNTLEFSNQPGQNIFGYRGKLSFAISDAHLVLAEIPLLYNDGTSKFGLGDVRGRYFWVPYKDYNKKLGAFGLSVDMFAPTGSFDSGLGTGKWVVAPGVTIGLMAADWIQFFPILSYQYAGKPVYENPSPIADRETHGFTFQVLTPIVFSEKFFVQLTPIFKMNNFNDIRQDRYEQEIFASYTIRSNMQITSFYSGRFKDKIHTLSAGLTIFLL